LGNPSKREKGPKGPKGISPKSGGVATLPKSVYLTGPGKGVLGKIRGAWATLRKREKEVVLRGLKGLVHGPNK